VRGDGLRYLPKGGFGDIHANWRAIVFDSEPEFTGSMLVEYGRHGIQALAKLCEAFLELDGFGFLHFRTGGVDRALRLSQLFCRRGAISKAGFSFLITAQNRKFRGIGIVHPLGEKNNPARGRFRRVERELRRGRYVGRFLIVVEGTLSDVQRAARGIHPNSISGTLASWAVRFCPIIFAGSTAGAADFAFRALASQVRDIQRAAQSIQAEPSAPATLPTQQTCHSGRTARRASQ
jgi:hypothetical protein